jgi:hypothetical protein
VISPADVVMSFGMAWFPDVINRSVAASLTEVTGQYVSPSTANDFIQILLSPSGLTTDQLKELVSQFILTHGRVPNVQELVDILYGASVDGWLKVGGNTYRVSRAGGWWCAYTDPYLPFVSIPHSQNKKPIETLTLTSVQFAGLRQDQGQCQMPNPLNLANGIKNLKEVSCKSNKTAWDGTRNSCTQASCIDAKQGRQFVVVGPKGAERISGSGSEHRCSLEPSNDVWVGGIARPKKVCLVAYARSQTGKFGAPAGEVRCRMETTEFLER